ncbi:Leucine Rich repeats (2 copies) [Anatilimnocola aggregata]|uniref:Leucine Rich repeats (2 copies) n=1 Tax=Anatilimnocola aggregata TaxID=2528021 RepID=A0A517Y4M9_9BACT|nr:S8 family serine peptidase [Anatilimnocola aggregata]QDU25140.1 Leucine Rich repeats (2 copies) [Anatilimnocola aggregata]
MRTAWWSVSRGFAVSACMLLPLSMFAAEPTNPKEFATTRILDVWQKYDGQLTFGKGQTLALVDDGCKLAMPQWQAKTDGVPKVLVTYDSVDGDDNPQHEGRGYHGSTIGIPSSVNYDGKRGVAFNNQLAVIRGLECCHCKVADGASLAKALQWVLENHAKYNITTVNLAPVDDLAHAEPVATDIDDKLAKLRAAGVWVSAPTGNHNFTNGISWPASQPNCFAIGAVRVAEDKVYLDRHAKVDLVVPAAATSSSNAICCGSVMILREAIEKAKYDWKPDGENLPAAMLAILQRTGKEVDDPATKLTFRRLDLLAAVEHVFAKADPKPECGADEAAEQQLTALGAQVTKAGDQISQISFKDCSKLGAAEFELIANQPELKKLTLYGSCKGLNNETLPLLKKLTKLEDVSTDGMQVTDAGFGPLAEMKSLKSLSFFHPSWGSKEFVGTGLVQLAGLPNLEKLTIAGTPFNDQGMAAVGKLTQLKAFRTWHTFQTEAGNQHLLKLTNLKELRLGQRLRQYNGQPNPPSLTDDTIQVIAQLTSLESLWLDEARLSGTALAQLKGLPNLKLLTLERVDIADAEVEQLKKELPNVKIDVKPMTDEQRAALAKMLKP